MKRIAIDTGGTFTDCVYLDGHSFVVLKIFSTPRDPGVAVMNGVHQIVPPGTGAEVVVRHGTTVGTNAMLERKGARVAFVTTAGFEDTIAIGRQARPKLYDWFQPAPQPLVPQDLRFGIHERVAADGTLLRGVDPAELQTLAETIRNSGAESIAISLLFGFANPCNEVTVARCLEALGLPVSVSHRILPEFREYERGSTLAANAYLAPLVGKYVTGLATALEADYPGSRLEVMQSSGGIIPARLAAAEPVRTVLSGPAGGVIGAAKLASLAGFDRILAFDMGGTSTDVCLVDGAQGGLHITNESIVSGVPIGVPMLDIHTAGAGGGSIARFDTGGMLRVGPESAGSRPGPICFGAGELPTVTDANLLLGRLDTNRFVGGSVALHLDRTREWMELSKGPLATVEEFAAGIVKVVETSMMKALRVISVERGFDPRDFTLVAFGGGGPVHACSLAHALQIRRVMVPAMPGALSALGILLADTVREYSRTVMLPADASLEAVFAALERQAVADFAAEGLTGVPVCSVDLRYAGQGYEINVPHTKAMLTQFHEQHQLRYGFHNLSRAIEVVHVRLRMVSAAPPYTPAPEPVVNGDGSQARLGSRQVHFDTSFHETLLYEREKLRPGDTFPGPAMVTEYSSATVLPPGDVLRVDGFGNLLIEVHA